MSPTTQNRPKPRPTAKGSVKPKKPKRKVIGPLWRVKKIWICCRCGNKLDLKGSIDGCHTLQYDCRYQARHCHCRNVNGSWHLRCGHCKLREVKFELPVECIVDHEYVID